MRAAFEGVLPRSLIARALLGAGGALLAVSVFAGGGAADARLPSVGAAAVVAAAAGLVALLLGRVAIPRLEGDGTALLVLLAGSVLWAGLSIAWSIEGDRSWQVLNRGLVYLSLLGLGVLAGAASRRSPRLAAGALGVVFGAAVLWALAGKVVPALGPDALRSARLREPVGYWNALALLVAMAVPVWLWLVAERGHAVRLRMAASALLVASFAALLLTTSRGGLLVAAVAVTAWLLLTGARLEGAVALLLAAPAGLLVGAVGLTLDGVSEAGTRDRGAEGAFFGAVLVVACAAVAAAVAWLIRKERRRELSSQRRRALGRLVVAVAAGLVLVGLVAGIVRVGNPVAWAGDRIDEFRNPTTANLGEGPARIVSFSSNHRWTWWNESWDLFRADPWSGSGAGTFELARKPLREDTQAPIAPHQIALQALAETGVAGFLLLAGAIGAAVWVVARALRRLADPDRGAAVALGAALAAYLAHSLIDMGWEYLAVTAPALLALGVLVTAGRTAKERPARPLAAAAVAATALTVLASIALPWLAERKLDDAYDAFDREEAIEAARAAADARDLNPLAIEPLFVQALAAELAGAYRAALAFYDEAIHLQPRNADTHFQLGVFHLETLNDPCRAYDALNDAYTLDPRGPAGEPGGPLDQAREVRNSGRCG
jgi:tetratricopeptide (TPR) repeat protein